MWLKNTKNNDLAISHLREIIKDRSGKFNQNIQIDALSELLNLHYSKAIPELVDFIKNGDQKSRIAALELATKTEDDTFLTGLVDLLKNASPDIQSDIIYTFGRRHYSATRAIILEYMKDENKNVRISSIE